MKCRFCGANLEHVVCDLITAPPSNDYLSQTELLMPEFYYPLKVFVCDKCWLVQVEEFKKCNEIFGRNYRYYSSYSSLWLQHAERYVSMIIKRLNLTTQSKVMEIASNDGYLLQYFRQQKVPCFGVDPADGPAASAAEKGVETIVSFFDSRLAIELCRSKGKQDLIIGNNVLAHVPSINDFVAGIRLILASEGTLTMEFPHLLELINDTQFDTIYHEHFCYLSLGTVQSIFLQHGLRIYDVEKFSTHGGSLRIYACHCGDTSHPTRDSVPHLISEEQKAGLFKEDTYRRFQERVDIIRTQFLTFLIEQKKAGKRVIGYGAAAKGNTLLNYCGIKGTDLISYVADASPYKQGFFLPGARIPIVHPDTIKNDRPDYIIIFPWNIKNEIVQQLSFVREWGGKFIIAVPDIEILEP